MLKNRIVILAGVLIVILALAVPIVTAQTEVAAGPSGNSAGWEKYRASEVAAGPSGNLAALKIYRASEVAAGPSGNSTAWEIYRAQEVLQSESSMQSPRTTLEDCFDVSLSELEDCRSVN